MAKTDNQRKIERQGYIEAGAHLYSAASSLYSGHLSARAAALDADWQNTRALYDEAIIADELLQGMAEAEVAQAASGFAGGGGQFALQALDAATKAAKARRAVRLRARVEAARALFVGGNALRQGGENALTFARRASSAITKARERMGEVAIP